MLRKAPELPSVVIDQPVITPEQEQEKWLGEALIKLKERSMHLRKAMETDAIYEVLRWASALLSELRTNLLTPQNYYEVYMKTFDVLLELEAYFLSEVQKGRKAGELYEVVQYAGNVVPRIYLLITIGSVYIQTKQANAKDILKDLVEMCKGVQNPTRGLFLRNYLSQLTKNKLPDEYEEGNEYAGKGGSVEDSVAFILQNFREMTWLWVRMGVKNVMGNVQKREKERKELRLLVGFNLVRLSQLDGVTKKYYKSFVLPQVLDIICAFEDGTAQQYLYECVIQVFPDEYHIATIDQLLGALAKLTDAVALQPLLCSLMNRLASFALRVREGDESIKLRSAETATLQDMFRIFHEKIGQLGREGRFGQSAFAQTHLSLLSLVLKAYTWEKNRVDDLTQSMVEYFHRTAPDSEAVRVIRELLERITVEIPHVVETLDLVHYKDLMDTLPFHPRREVALAVARSVICCNQPISTLDRTTRLLDMLAPLMYDVADRPSNADSVYLMSPEEEFEEEQHLVCKMMHSIENKEDYALTLKLLSLVRKEVGRGGEERMKHTLIALTNALLRFAIRVRKAEAAEVATGVRIEKIFGYLHSNGSGKGLLEMLARDVPYTAMQLYLKSGNTADVCGLAETAYELFGEAFLLYEERCPDSKVQVRFLDSMVSSLCLVSSLSMEHFEILSMKVCQYSSKLLRRPDQCRAVTTCSHVFASKLLPDADPSFRKKILDCLQRGLKVVHQCPRSQQTPLLVELLNHYAYYFQTETPNVGAKYINTLLELIDKEQASEAEGGNANRDGSDEESDDDMPPIRKLDVKGGGKNASATPAADAAGVEGMASVDIYYKNTRQFIARKKESDPDRWKDVNL